MRYTDYDSFKNQQNLKTDIKTEDEKAVNSDIHLPSQHTMDVISQENRIHNSIRQYRTFEEWQKEVDEGRITIETVNQSLTLLQEAMIVVNEDDDEFDTQSFQQLLEDFADDNGMKIFFNEDGTLQDKLEVLDEGKFLKLLNPATLGNFVYDQITSVKKGLKNVATSVAAPGVKAVSATAIASGGYAAIAGASITLTSLAVLVGAFVGAMSTVLYRRNKGYAIRFGGLMGVKVRDGVYHTYMVALREVFKKRRIPFKMQAKGSEIVLTGEFNMPGFDPPKFVLTIKENIISFYPESTGGSTALDKYVFKRESIDLGGKKIQKKNSLDIILDQLEDFAGKGYLGKDYKVPRRKLTYKQDMIIMFYIIIDTISEILADFAVMYKEMVTRLQASKQGDVNIFNDFLDKWDIEKTFMQDKEYIALQKEKEELKRRERDDSRGNGDARTATPHTPPDVTNDRLRSSETSNRLGAQSSPNFTVSGGRPERYF